MKVLLLVASIGFAHPGGRDAHGCHVEKATGERHCHEAPKKTVPQSLPARVVGVSDGDTVTVLIEGKQRKVRLFGIDAPEKKQAFGSKAKQHLSSLIFGKDVQIEIRDVDRYGRLVASIAVENESVNLAMVRAGFAWWYRAYAKNDTDLEAAENEARAAGRGLWADKKPMEPWAWRKR